MKDKNGKKKKKKKTKCLKCTLIWEKKWNIIKIQKCDRPIGDFNCKCILCYATKTKIRCLPKK